MSTIKIEDTNLANYGSDAHREAMKAAAASDPEFASAGQKVGIEIWRVENRRSDNDIAIFGVKRWDKELYGQFFDGDSYIILNTYKKSKNSEALAWDVHFWLGEDSTQDERGVAAYKTIELDDLLDDGPIQHREIMGNESALFLSYFKNMAGLKYMQGGIESGFRHVAPEEYKPRLLQIKRAKKTTRSKEVKLSIESMNKGDCFILDLGTKVFKYLGSEASPFEKSHAANICSNIIMGRHGKSKEVNIDSDPDFWGTLEGTEADVMHADEVAATDDLSASAPTDVKIFRITDEGSGNMVRFEHVEKSGPGYSLTDLDSGDVFLVDAGTALFMWIGNGSSKQERSFSWKFVDKYIEHEGRPSNIPVTVLPEGAINAAFHSCFAA